MRLRCHFFLLLGLTGILLAGVGCGSGSARERREDRDPLIRGAREKKAAGDIDGAIEAYQRALDKKPQLGRAHLELGWIYDHDREDHVRAIYHYQRYLEMRPEAEKQDLVRDLIAQARILYAASLPEKPNEAIRQIALLKEENAALRAQLDRSAPVPRSTLPSAAPSAAAAPARPAIAPVATPAPQPTPVVAAPAPTPAAATTYVVQPGDTLSRIAGRMYGDSKKWQQIYDANRASMPGGPQSMKVGQTLVIPNAERR
ncbi:MAG TPA: LysM peptidoglycan-binding domain-containing protein [Kiritimatiellia bacterium]|nr:LysM peptidoglycan-binding domain-containing protein [Kiritimatiellia bacterium]